MPAEKVFKYLDETANAEIAGLEAVRRMTFERFGDEVRKMSGVEVCQFVRWIVKQMNVTRALELGVFTGSSSLAILDGLGPDGRLDAIDVSADYTSVARDVWSAEGFDSKVNLILDDALKVLAGLDQRPTYDFAYVDALKEEYPAYQDAIVPLMKQGGLIVFNNILWKGLVADPETTDASARLIQASNLKLRDDPRLDTTFISLDDGLALCKVL